MSTLNAYELALLGDEIASPDSNESPGANFLLGIQSAVEDALTDASQHLSAQTEAGLRSRQHWATDDVQETASEIADGAVPVYTHEMWSTFVDLAAYNVDISDWGAIQDMEEGAQLALFVVAERIALALLESNEEDKQRGKTMNIFEVLEYGPIVAKDEDLGLLITVNGAYFNLWVDLNGDGTDFSNTEAYDAQSRLAQGLTVFANTLGDVADAAEALDDEIVREAKEGDEEE